MEWNVAIAKISKTKGVRFKYLRGVNKLMINEVSLVMDGKEVCKDIHYDETGISDLNNYYRLNVPAGATGNNSCVLRAKVKSDGKSDSYGSVCNHSAKISMS